MSLLKLIFLHSCDKIEKALSNSITVNKLNKRNNLIGCPKKSMQAMLKLTKSTKGEMRKDESDPQVGNKNLKILLIGLLPQ